MTRPEARELAMKMLFEMDFQKDFGEEIKTRIMNENEDCLEQEGYLEGMYAALADCLPAADQLIETCSKNWKIGRMCKVDLAIIRMATLEILHMEDIPCAVSINEAVDLAKKYGTEDSGKFVNGILGKIVKSKNAS